jgi:hypothetical protein
MPAGRQSSGRLAVAFGWGLITLLSAAGLIALASRVQLGPQVGDIVAFAPPAAPSVASGGDPTDTPPINPAEGVPPDLTSRVTLAKATGGSCSLDLEQIRQNGGSLLVEARRPDSALPYQAHWAGLREGETDCGRSADLLISDSDISLLAITAGGYGVPGKRQFVAAPWIGETLVR